MRSYYPRDVTYYPRDVTYYPRDISYYPHLSTYYPHLINNQFTIGLFKYANLQRYDIRGI